MVSTALFLALLVPGDGAETPPPELTQHQILPVIRLRCTVCHGLRQKDGGLDLRSRAAMLRGGATGAVVVPGDPGRSPILARVRSGACPPREKLVDASVKPMEAAEIERLERWIALGAPEGTDEAASDLQPREPPARPEALEFWSFRPPQRSAPPAVRRPELLRGPIDAFLLARLEEKGLSFAPEAPREVFIRRVTYDLTGLPPSPEEVAAFVADPAPDAHERLVDRLLASPRYGESWARHWLDVAGYADSEGKREQDLPRPDAWRYRDYVIASLNGDKPYDRFLLEQLAGDELAGWRGETTVTPEVHDALVATGFLRMAPDPTWANITGFVPDRLEVIADEMEILGASVLGLTFKCARCHDHKFDPISQRDYYRLTAIWKGALDEHDWLRPELANLGAPVSADRNGDRRLRVALPEERRAFEEATRRLDEEVRAAREAKDEAKVKALEARRPPPPEHPIRALWDRGEPTPVYLYRRGNYLDPGPLVEPGLPVFLSRGELLGDPPAAGGPAGGAGSAGGAAPTGRRLAFARWLTREDHPLTARVMANRIWRHHFGSGIVSTLDNFGKAGARPTHRELLDFLAVELRESGWSLKALHRLILTSAAYRQSSSASPEALRLDPDGSLLSRMPLRRLDAEEIHDAILSVAGSLDGTSFGPPAAIERRADGLITPAASPRGWRRIIYVLRERKGIPTILENFDFPLPNPACSERRCSTVAPQALQLFGDGWIQGHAGRFARRVAREAGDDPGRRIERAFLLALGRPPEAPELAAGLDSLERLRAAWSREAAVASSAGPAGGGDAPGRALEALCHALLNSAAFIHID